MSGPGVVLLGGTAGVGLETACRFAEQGARGVCLLGRDAERGARACDAVRARAAGADVTFIAVDARDERQVAAAVASARERLGRIDVLVTSTGPSKPPRLRARMFEKAAALAHLGVAEPEDLAESILFLAGPGARRITGQALSVNGGISAA